MAYKYRIGFVIFCYLLCHLTRVVGAEFQDGQITYPEFYSHKAGDDVAWAQPHYDDSEWAQVENETFPSDGWQGISWFRFALEVDSTLSGVPLGISVSQRGAAEIYLNGKRLYQLGKVGSSKEEEQAGSYWNLRNFSLPTGLVTDASGKTRHLLAIRYSNFSFDAPQWSGFGPEIGFEINNLNQLSTDRGTFIRNVTANQLALMSVCLAFALLHTLLFLFYMKLRANLYYAIITVLAAVNIYFELQLELVQEPANLIWAQRLAHISFTLFALACLRFMYAINYHKRPRIFLFFGLLGMSLCVWTWFRPFAVQQPLFLFMLAIIAEIGRAFIARRKHEKLIGGSWIIGVGASLLVLGAMYNILGSFKIIPILWSFTDFPTPYYGMLGFMVAMSTFLARHFALTNRNLEAKLVEVKELSEKTLQQEVERTKLEAENARKTRELEEARKLQLSMLPKAVPDVHNLDIAVYMQTATEVGGDYYDFKLHEDGTLTAVIGDATGHGLQAGTMVSATKSLFNALADDPDPVRILSKGTMALNEMHLQKMFMALTIAKIRDNQMQIAAAGMPYALVYRIDSKRVEEVVLKGMPLGSVASFNYQQEELDLKKGDTVLFMSDGFPEMFNEQNEELGEERAKTLFQEAAEKSPEQIIEHLVEAGKKWANGQDQKDDVTFMIIRFKA